MLLAAMRDGDDEQMLALADNVAYCLNSLSQSGQGVQAAGAGGLGLRSCGGLGLGGSGPGLRVLRLGFRP